MQRQDQRRKEPKAGVLLPLFCFRLDAAGTYNPHYIEKTTRENQKCALNAVFFFSNSYTESTCQRKFLTVQMGPGDVAYLRLSTIYTCLILSSSIGNLSGNALSVLTFIIGEAKYRFLNLNFCEGRQKLTERTGCRANRNKWKFCQA